MVYFRNELHRCSSIPKLILCYEIIPNDVLMHYSLILGKTCVYHPATYIHILLLDYGVLFFYFKEI